VTETSQQPGATLLDHHDPLEATLAHIATIARTKRRDYALDGHPYSNFHDTATMLGLPGFTEVESACFNVLQKIARLRSLRANGRLTDPTNETVQDTYLDLACYAVIAATLNTLRTAQ
jgi:hypothetical protein